MTKIYELLNPLIQKELPCSNSMPLTATYTNQNNILDSHNNNTNKNTYYVQKQLSSRSCNDSSINGKVFHNNENETKNDSNINSDVQCWLDFVLECSTKKENPSKNVKSNRSNGNNNNNKNETYQTSSSSTYYNSSNTTARNDSNYQSSFNNTTNDKDDYYSKSNIKMKSQTSIQSLCDPKDQEINFSSQRRRSQDIIMKNEFIYDTRKDNTYHNNNNNNECSYDSIQDKNKSNYRPYTNYSKPYPNENEYSNDYYQNEMSQYRNINSSQNLSQSYYSQNYHSRSRSHSQPQTHSESQTYQNDKSRSHSQTQSPVYQSDQQQNFFKFL
ncbi:hypothetical protein LY90DRAFT_125641 [Neocallimastix californiae]|uniref:Uncharacterized protein n=1 Tax=Neocallimastix californiae TaxID=1754190 RepID=A0A1Y2EYG5_9FUNG|nr:hypothetical protein LY90DRAFT_125641 [Neocallimastix californiae]|eukprot:ORY75825.1 hypothetical protein LY90DRAFT_125641 [Neocallimastix californiae]